MRVVEIPFIFGGLLTVPVLASRDAGIVRYECIRHHRRIYGSFPSLLAAC
jgi:hypothetical protein